MVAAPGRSSKWIGASTCVPAWSLKEIDSAFELIVVFPAVTFSLWSFHTVMITGGWLGWVCVR